MNVKEPITRWHYSKSDGSEHVSNGTNVMYYYIEMTASGYKLFCNVIGSSTSRILAHILQVEKPRWRLKVF